MRRSTTKKTAGDLLSRPLPTGVLLRKCACGNQTVAGGECQECAKEKTTLQRKPASAREVTEVPASVHDVLNSPGQPLDAETRGFMEPRFGHDFSQVRLHSDAQAAKSAEAVSALAYTVGRDVVFGAGQYEPTTSEGRRLLAHELTHVTQQGGLSTGQLQTMGGEGLLETEADRNASLVDSGAEPSFGTHAAPTNGLRLQRKKRAPGEISPRLHFAMIMSFATVMTADDARSALDEFKKMSKAEQRTSFEEHYPTGAISKLLKALPAEDASGNYRNEVRQLLRWIEEAETRASSGKSDEDMAALKGADMKTKAQADAKAAKAATGSTAAPTAAEVAVAQEEDVKKTSVPAATTNRWDALSPKKRKAMINEGNQAIADLIAHAAKTHPELKLTTASFRLDFWGVDDRGQNVLAMSGTTGGKPVAVVGFDFVTAVKVNPAYALSTVVHEVFGHPEYGVYGTEYHLSLYDKAVAKAGFTKKAEGTPARLSEKDSYAYQETEIYSLMRELPYWTPVSAADEKASPGLTGLNFDPKDGITSRIGKIKEQWHGIGLAVALLHGLYARLRNDPRMTKVALDAFQAGLKVHFKAAEVKEIMK
jgi:hypothetical protein